MKVATEHRQGDSFARIVFLKGIDGEPLPLPATDLIAQLYRPDGTMLAPLTIADGASTGYYVVSTTANTSAWPLETLKANVFDKSDKTSSDFFYVMITEQGSRELV